MKYVIFKKDECVMPIIFHEHINHCEVSLGIEWIPVSAGFIYMGKGEIEISEKGSESLELKPIPDRDKLLINSLLMNFSLGLFMDYEHEWYPNVELESFTRKELQSQDKEQPNNIDNEECVNNVDGANKNEVQKEAHCG